MTVVGCAGIVGPILEGRQHAARGVGTDFHVLDGNDDMMGMIEAGEPVNTMAIFPLPELTPCLCACIGLPRAVEASLPASSVRGW